MPTEPDERGSGEATDDTIRVVIADDSLPMLQVPYGPEDRGPGPVTNNTRRVVIANDSPGIGDGGGSGDGDDTLIPLRVGFSGGGGVIAVGTKARIARVVGARTITGWRIIGDPSGSITVRVSRSTFAAYPTMTVISASAPITLSGATKAESSSLTGWTTSLADGDILEFEVLTASTVEDVQIELLTS